MIHKKNYPLTLLIIFSLMCLFNHKAIAKNSTLSIEQKKFLQAEKMIHNNQWKSLKKAKAKLKDYPLYPYLDYKTLKHKIIKQDAKKVSLKAIQKFDKNNPDFPFTFFLKKNWLKKKFEAGEYKAVLSALPENIDQQSFEHQCYSLYSQWRTHKNKKIFKKVKKIWLVGHSQPKSCDPLFRAWAKNGGYTQKLIFERFKLVMQQRNYNLAHFLVKKLKSNKKAVAQKWIDFNYSPDRIFSQKAIKKAKFGKDILPEVLATSLQKLARKNAGRAMGWWKKNKTKYKFSKQQTQRIERDIGVYLAHQKHPKALKFLSSVDDSNLDSIARAWRVRMSLFQEKWSDTSKWIQALPAKERNEAKWQYWNARAMDSLGQEKQAKALYQTLAKQRHFYGFMASLQLKQKPTITNHPLKLQKSTLQRLNKLPAMARIKELLELNRPRIARIEWNQLTKNLPEKQLVHLAQIAYQNKWYDLSILTLTKSDQRDDLALRFPLAHKKHIIHYAKHHKLDPAWIFALTRQESAFFSHAESPVGARGLMQLMPKTARYIANKSKIKYKSKSHLYYPRKNIELGTTYLKFLNKKWHNHPILATASYNAGPSRIKRWLPSKAIAADIWIENIPYKETRNYVKNVMASTSVYHKILGQKVKLKQFMKPINVR